MADRYDNILEKFFTGGLDLEIKIREQELRHPQQEPDENIGGGRAQYKRSNAVESTMMKIEADIKLNELNRLKSAIKACVDMFDDEHKAVFYQWYRNKMTWQQIADIHHIDVSSGRRWRDELKQICRSYNIENNEHIE